MKLDWAIDTFRALISGGVIWIVIYLRKKTIPFYKGAKKFIQLIDLTGKHHEYISLNNSYRKAMWDVLRDPIFTTNNKGEVTYVNPAYAKVMGLNDPRDVFGFNYMALIPKEDKPTIVEESKRLVEHPGTFEGVIKFIHQQSGALITTECRTAPIYNDKGEWQGNLGRLYVLSIKNPTT